MENRNIRFVEDLEAFETKAIDRVNEVRKLLAYDVFSRVIDRTPVYFAYEPTSGNTKYNWTCTINKLSRKVLKGTDKNGARTKARMWKVLARAKGDDTIFFANSVPHINVLEDGGYPSMVKRGSYNKKTHKWEIRSAGGYSKQSPKGMVKVTIAEFPYLQNKAVQEAKSKVP